MQKDEGDLGSLLTCLSEKKNFSCNFKCVKAYYFINNREILRMATSSRALGMGFSRETDPRN